MIPLSQGGNAPVHTAEVSVTIGWQPERVGGLEVDASAFLLTAGGKVRGDADMVFYNQPASKDGSVRLANGQFTIDLARLPAEIERIAFAATIHEGTVGAARFANAEVAFMEVAGVARYDAATAGMAEAALILGELYRRHETWKVRAIGQGFVGGLGPLAMHFGVDVSAPTATPAISLRAVSLEKKLVDLAKHDPRLVSLVKKVQVSLAKKNLVTDRAKVALVLDISGSMSGLYSSGKVQHLVERAMAVAYRFDDDGEIDVFLFGSNDHEYGSLTTDTYRGFVPAMLRRYPLEGGTRYGQAMQRVRAFYRGKPDWGTMPVYVMFVTDGGTQDEALSERMIREAASEPIFWCFMAIGRAPDSKPRGWFSLPSGFEFLARLDTMQDRVVDNAHFFAVEDPSAPGDEELFELMMEEFPEWQTAAHNAGLFQA